MKELVWLVTVGILCLAAMVVSVPTVAGDIWAGLSAMLSL